MRYATKIEAVTALRDLHANFEKWQPMVPTSNSKYRKYLFCLLSVRLWY